MAPISIVPGVEVNLDISSIGLVIHDGQNIPLNFSIVITPPSPYPPPQSGLYFINPTKAQKHDSYYDNLENKIPNPTFRTAFVGNSMPKGAALSELSSGESISHFTAVRIRLNGAGSLQLAMFSLDNVRSTTLLPLTMATLTNIIPTRLCNFVEQRAQLEGKTTVIDEVMRINRIIIFSKELYTSYPG